MSAQNRAISTCALVSMLRYLMSELSQTLDTANAIARTERDDEVQVEVPEEEDDNLLMQTFFLTDGKDSKEGRWSRAILRLQKELMAQPRQAGWATLQLLQLGIPPAQGGESPGPWREQLEALLVSMRAEEAERESVRVADGSWLVQWQTELAAFIPNYRLPATPITIDTQSSTASGMLDAELDKATGGRAE